MVGDLPWLSYHVDAADTVRNAAALIRAGAQAVKLEGGPNRVPMIEALVDAEIPVMGHLGLTPQSINAMGGFQVQGRDDAAAQRSGGRRQGAGRTPGCFAVVLEGVPDEVGAAGHRRASTCPPSASGPDRPATARSWSSTTCSGSTSRVPKFVRRYAELGATAAVAAVRRLRRRRALGGLPGRRRDLPLSRPAGAVRRARPHCR